MNKRIKRVALLNGLLAITAFAIGCESTNGDHTQVSTDSVHSDMSPELDTVALSQDQHDTQVTRAIDTNLRQIHDDIDSAFLLFDRPSRMTRYPVP